MSKKFAIRSWDHTISAIRGCQKATGIESEKITTPKQGLVPLDDALEDAMKSAFAR